MSGDTHTATLTRSVESWQFFAFMFAATVTLFFALMEEVVISCWGWRVALKLMGFVVLAYIILWNRRSRNMQVRLLNKLKVERY